MPSPLSNFADTEIRMRYREPFLTEGLDLKLAVNTPPGIYRGFRLSTHGSALNISVVGDAVFSDHAAVYQAGTGHSLTIRRTGGTFAVDLTAFTSKTVIIAIFCTYALGSPTTGELRVYELSPSDEFTGAAERPELVVLGTVVVPASGLIPAGNIKLDRRTSAWMATAPEATQWMPIVRNGGFEVADDTQTYRHAVSFWELTTTAGGNWRPNSGGGIPHSGFKALELNVSASPITASASQRVELPVTPATRMIRVQAWVRSLIAPTVAALVDIALNWGGTTGADLGTPSLVPLVVVGATDGAYRLVEAIVEVPVTAAILKTVEIRALAQTYGSTGVALRVDDVQVFVEARGGLDVREAELRAGVGEYDAVILEDPLTLVAGQLAGLLRFDKALPNASEGEIVLDRKDRDYTGGKLPPALAPLGRLVNIGRQLLGTAADARKARLSTPFHNSFDATLIWESTPIAGSVPSVRLYVSLSGLVLLTINASYDGTNWNKDFAGSLSTLFQVRRGTVEIYFREADAAWTTWTQINRVAGPAITTLANPDYEPLLAHFDASANRRVAVDHIGFPGNHVSELREEWLDLSSSSIPNGTVLRFWTFAVSGTGNQYRDKIQDGVDYRMGVRGLFQNIGNGAGVATAETVQLFIGSGPGFLGNEFPHQDQVQVWTWDVCAYGFVGANPGGTLEHGIRGNNARATFKKNDGNANWQLLTQINAGTNTLVDTGVPVSAGPQRLRLEMYGANTPGGRRVLGYIDGVLVAESTTNLPDVASVVDWRFEAVRTTAVTTKFVAIGPLVGRWSRFLSDDAL